MLIIASILLLIDYLAFIIFIRAAYFIIYYIFFSLIIYLYIFHIRLFSLIIDYISSQPISLFDFHIDRIFEILLIRHCHWYFLSVNIYDYCHLETCCHWLILIAIFIIIFIIVFDIFIYLRLYYYCFTFHYISFDIFDIADIT